MQDCSIRLHSIYPGVPNELAAGCTLSACCQLVFVMHSNTTCNRRHDTSAVFPFDSFLNRWCVTAFAGVEEWFSVTVTHNPENNFVSAAARWAEWAVSSEHLWASSKSFDNVSAVVMTAKTQTHSMSVTTSVWCDSSTRNQSQNDLRMKSHKLV